MDSIEISTTERNGEITKIFTIALVFNGRKLKLRFFGDPASGSTHITVVRGSGPNREFPSLTLIAEDPLSIDRDTLEGTTWKVNVGFHGMWNTIVLNEWSHPHEAFKSATASHWGLNLF